MTFNVFECAHPLNILCVTCFHPRNFVDRICLVFVNVTQVVLAADKVVFGNKLENVDYRKDVAAAHF